jgi:hypothetical protein
MESIQSNIQSNSEHTLVETDQRRVESLIYLVRNKQVMFDEDLATLYQVDTGLLNRAVKRNINRFPDDFRFQLTKVEYEALRCQIGISNNDNIADGRGGRRYIPYAFTEQGIAMLSSVLRSHIAANVSIGIMRAFVEMRKFIANNALLFERISDIELKQLEYQRKTDERLEQVFEFISDQAQPAQKIFYDGQIYDAFSLMVDLVSKAENEIILIDNYVDVDTLNILSKKKSGVNVTIYTSKRTKLSLTDVGIFNKQYPLLTLGYTEVFHDRFMILDNNTAYHIGASIKDAGKKSFAVSVLQDEKLVKDILNRLSQYQST